MNNELIILTAIVFSFSIITLTFRYQRLRLIGILAFLVVLANIFGVKWVTYYGYVINMGNILYATTFYIFHLILEHQKKSEAYQAIWFASFGMLFVTIISFLAVNTTGLSQNDMVNQALYAVFTVTPRVMLASVLAFIVAQYLNIWIYTSFQKRDGKKNLFLRSFLSLAIGQLIDTALFFAVAFYEVMPLDDLMRYAWVGFLVKLLIGLIGIPLLYLSRHISQTPERKPARS